MQDDGVRTRAVASSVEGHQGKFESSRAVRQMDERGSSHLGRPMRSAKCWSAGQAKAEQQRRARKRWFASRAGLPRIRAEVRRAQASRIS